MKTRPMVIVLAAAVLLLAAWLAWRSGPGPEPAPVASSTPPATQTGEVIPSSLSPTPPGAGSPAKPAASAASAMANESAPGRPSVGTPTPGATTSATPRADGGSASVEVNKVHRMIVDYHTLMGENPVGTNAEIMRALTGRNPRQATLGPPEGQSLNDKGELVDPWGTPYFFHQLSRDHMEVRSAGPDKIMGTADDLVAK